MVPEKMIKPITIGLVILMLIGTVWGTYFYAPTAVAQNKEKETVDSSYVEKVFNEEALCKIEIEINNADWQYLMNNAIEDTFKSCTVTIGGKTFYNVGIKPKGNSSLNSVASLGSTRYSLKLDFDEFVPGQTCFGLEALALNNGISDTTNMKESLSYDVYKLLGVATQLKAYSEIFVNGERHGTYLVVEVINETFMQRSFGSQEGNLYKPESMAMGGAAGGGLQRQNGMGLPEGLKLPEGVDPKAMREMMQKGGQGAPGGMAMPEGMQLPEGMEMPDGFNPMGMMGSGGGANLKYSDDKASSYQVIREGTVTKRTSDADFENVIKMIKSLDSGENIEKYLDVEEVLKYFAVNTFLVNLDSYSGSMYHNYYLYEKDGVSQIIPWDLNMSFGGYSMGAGGASEIINFPIDQPTTDTLENAPLIGKLLENPVYKEKYHGYLQTIVDAYYKSGMFESEVDKKDALIQESMKVDPTYFSTYEEYVAGVKELKVFMKERSASVEAQLLGTQPTEEAGTMPATVDMSKLGDMQSMGIGGGPMGDAQMGDVPMGNAPMGDAQMGKAPMGDAQMGKAPMGDAPMGNARMGKPPAGLAVGNPVAMSNSMSGMPITSMLSGVLPFLKYLLLIIGSIITLFVIKRMPRKRYM